MFAQALRPSHATACTTEGMGSFASPPYRYPNAVVQLHEAASTASFLQLAVILTLLQGACHFLFAHARCGCRAQILAECTGKSATIELVPWSCVLEEAPVRTLGVEDPSPWPLHKHYKPSSKYVVWVKTG